MATQLTLLHFLRDLKKQVEQIGLPSIRFHDLRHSHATLLIQQNINPKVISERLGHSSIQITLNQYSHVLPSMQQEVANKLDEVIVVNNSVTNLLPINKKEELKFL